MYDVCMLCKRGWCGCYHGIYVIINNLALAQFPVYSMRGINRIYAQHYCLIYSPNSTHLHINYLQYLELGTIRSSFLHVQLFSLLHSQFLSIVRPSLLLLFINVIRKTQRNAKYVLSLCLPLPLSSHGEYAAAYFTLHVTQ